MSIDQKQGGEVELSFADVTRDWLAVLLQFRSSHLSSPLPIALSAVRLQSLLGKHNNGKIC